MMGFGKNKPAKEWRNWLTKRQELQDKLGHLTAQRHDAKRQLDKAKWEASAQRRTLLELTGVEVHNIQASSLPSPAQTAARIEQELQHQEAYRAAGQRFSWNLTDVHQELSSLQRLISDVDTANARHDELIEEEENTRKAAETVEAAPPKAGHGALEAFDAEIQAIEASVQHIDQTLEAMQDGASLLADAQTEVLRAQEQVDELEAAAALGEIDDSEKATASTTLKKAQAEVENAKAQANRQEAARRGLQSKRTAFAERLEELRQMHADIAREVFTEDLASHEQRLVEILASRDVQELVEAINSTRKRFNQAINFGDSRPSVNSPLEPLKLTVELKHLSHHPDHKQLNRSGIKV